jgi:hypothetical protein
MDPDDGATKDLSGGLKGSMNEARLLAGLGKTFVTQAQLANHIDHTLESGCGPGLPGKIFAALVVRTRSP